ncbi:putative gamma-glutamylcyclotransferase [Vibrio inusitatus NBRC 102082]|uniref:Gamma-glutamylcyclotransferase family protein n=1 Tax=Vibrio inusitatus NBRC 102082 TaxID=1219070 RepID=A0A4Y3HTS9_9VIBR|nr:gamma-glutamylcyclotransferase [Vibrio inusitatus]GEA50458.1 putative gamma-glutamylcyclotransferase [Vibrio inusitatus NBRC 102082]
MQHLVFVYGTLRQDEANHYLLQGSEFLGLFETPPQYALYDFSTLPGIVEGHEIITGEVYRISDEVLVKLDIFEDVPIEYRRETIETPFGEAWIYLYQGTEAGKAIESGDWNLRN